MPGIVDRSGCSRSRSRSESARPCGILRKQRGLRRFFRLSGSADALYDALAPHNDVIDGFHYFTFNRLLDTWNWERGKRTSMAPEAQKEVTPT